MTPENEGIGKIWVTSDVIENGQYAVTIAFTDDIAVTLSTVKAIAYAMAVLDAAHTADYDAAILAQLMTKGGLPLKTAIDYIRDNVRPFRSTRDTGTPLSLTPGISTDSHMPFIALFLNSKQIGQWTVADALDHARGVFDTISIAALDNGYYKSLVDRLGVSENQARGVVENISEFRIPRDVSES